MNIEREGQSTTWIRTSCSRPRSCAIVLWWKTLARSSNPLGGTFDILRTISLYSMPRPGGKSCVQQEDHEHLIVTGALDVQGGVTVRHHLLDHLEDEEEYKWEEEYRWEVAHASFVYLLYQSSHFPWVVRTSLEVTRLFSASLWNVLALAERKTISVDYSSVEGDAQSSDSPERSGRDIPFMIPINIQSLNMINICISTRVRGSCDYHVLCWQQYLTYTHGNSLATDDCVCCIVLQYIEIQ